MFVDVGPYFVVALLLLCCCFIVGLARRGSDPATGHKRVQERRADETELGSPSPVCRCVGVSVCECVSKCRSGTSLDPTTSTTLDIYINFFCCIFFVYFFPFFFLNFLSFFLPF